jgi:hypothetical protein
MIAVVLGLGSIGSAGACDSNQELQAKLDEAMKRISEVKLYEAMKRLSEVKADLAAGDECPDDPEVPTGQFAQVTDPAVVKVLGESWRDPSGLVWGDLVKKVDGSISYMSEYAAETYCASKGARLPSQAEQAQLGIYLGAKKLDKNSTDGTPVYDKSGNVLFRYDYHGYQAKILPHLAYAWIWSNTPHPRGSDGAFVFGGDYGGIDIAHDRSYDDGAVRCVR